jgi:hypothetical protein
MAGKYGNKRTRRREMKLDDKHPNAKIDELFEFNLTKKTDKEPCWHCKDVTSWYDTDCKAYVCSEECCDAKAAEIHDNILDILKERKKEREDE